MRTTTVITTDKSGQEVKDMLGNFFVENGYILQAYKKMQVWKKGSGWLTAPKIFKIDMAGDKITVESWIPTAILPGVYVGESGLNSGYGFAVKAGMRKMLKDIINMLIMQGTNVEGYVPK